MRNSLESTEIEKTRWKREIARSKTNLEMTQEEKDNWKIKKKKKDNSTRTICIRKSKIRITGITRRKEKEGDWEPTQRNKNFEAYGKNLTLE